MRLARTPRREAPETIIALIDVVFFLLVFFMLVGRLDATAPFELDPPEAASGADMPGGGLTLAVSAEGALALDGQAVARDAALDLARAAIEANPDLLVRINAHRAARLREVLPLVGEIEAMGAREVMLVITPPA